MSGPSGEVSPGSSLQSGQATRIRAPPGYCFIPVSLPHGSSVWTAAKRKRRHNLIVALPGTESVRVTPDSEATTVGRILPLAIHPDHTINETTLMLYNVKTLTGYKLYSLDGEIGHVKDFLFDDRHWTIRYLVADTGNWLTGRQVLISPYALVGALRLEQDISVDLTKKQIEDSPSLDSDQPVSQQFENDYYGYYGWPMYWGGTYAWGYYPYVIRNREQDREMTQREKSWDRNLRSTHAVSGYHIEATDGGIGHVADFLLDDETWAIRYLVVDTQNWWPGKKVLVSPQWLEGVSWSESKVFVKLTREAIKQAPEYKPDTLLDRDYEDRLHRHYGRKTYWADELVAK